MENMGFYYKIDVMGRNGYSFMVKSNEELNENEIISRCLDNDYFNDNLDADYAVIDDLISQYDIDNFSSCTFNI